MFQCAEHADHHQHPERGQHAAADLPAPAPDPGGYTEANHAQSRYGQGWKKPVLRKKNQYQHEFYTEFIFKNYLKMIKILS